MIGKVIVKEPTPIGDGRYAWTSHMNDDGDWYAEVIDTETGNVVHTTAALMERGPLAMLVDNWAKQSGHLPQEA